MKIRRCLLDNYAVVVVSEEEHDVIKVGYNDLLSYTLIFSSKNILRLSVFVVFAS